MKNPVLDVFTVWGAAMEPVVGSGNYSMEDSSTIYKTPYACLKMMGSSGARWDIEGDECATMPTFQVDSFASGQKALSKAYKIDEKSHEAMSSMGFRRYEGPTERPNVDKRIKRVVSRYRMLYTGQLMEERNEYY